MKVGFVITSHYSDLIRPNGQLFLDKITKSIIDNCSFNFNIYIVDNQSEYTLKYPKDDRVKYFRIEDQFKEGLTGAWNLGINASYEDNCDIIINCNDDLTFNSSVNTLIEEMANHSDSQNIIFQGVTNGILGGGPRYGTSPKPGTVLLDCTHHTRAPHGYCFAMTRTHYESYRYQQDKYFNKNNKNNGGDGKWGGQEGQFLDNAERGAYGIIINGCFINHAKIRAWKLAKKYDDKN